MRLWVGKSVFIVRTIHVSDKKYRSAFPCDFVEFGNDQFGTFCALFNIANTLTISIETVWSVPGIVRQMGRKEINLFPDMLSKSFTQIAMR